MQIAPVLTRSFAEKPKIIDLRNYCIAHYKMNDNAASSTVVDSQGFSNGTSVRNTNLMAVAGKVNGALSFNGTTDYIDTNDTFESTIKNSFSFNLWAKKLDVPVATILSAIKTSDYFVLLFDITGIRNCITIMFQAGGGGGRLPQLLGNAAWTVNEWLMITVVMEQINSTQVTASIYINGAFDNSATFNCILSNYTGTDNFIMGAIWDESGPGYDSFCNCVIDDVRFINKALSLDEIRFLYNADNGTEYLHGVL